MKVTYRGGECLLNGTELNKDAARALDMARVVRPFGVIFDDQMTIVGDTADATIYVRSVEVV